MATGYAIVRPSSEQGSRTGRVVWAFFSTPMRVFLGVMGPITIMMLVLALLPGVPVGIRLTAGVVVVLSAHAFRRGYLQRIEAWPTQVVFRTPGRTLAIPWDQVRRMDSYIPLDRNRATRYVYITRLDSPPVDWREIDENTIQLQDRAGLLETLHGYWKRHGPAGDIAPATMPTRT
ncbi:MAG: hypothetical protein AMXMBFR13_45130 [Phycisphaerae bacterium]